jgi:hypothetical protein
MLPQTNCKKKKALTIGQNLLFSRPFVGIIQIRFNGYDLRLIEISHPWREKELELYVT